MLHGRVLGSNTMVTDHWRMCLRGWIKRTMSGTGTRRLLSRIYLPTRTSMAKSTTRPTVNLQQTAHKGSKISCRASGLGIRQCVIAYRLVTTYQGYYYLSRMKLRKTRKLTVQHSYPLYWVATKQRYWLLQARMTTGLFIFLLVMFTIMYGVHTAMPLSL